MLSFRQILNECPLDELRECARACRLPTGGDKDSLISVLIRGHHMETILASLGSQCLRDICSRHELSVSGNKGLLVERISSIVMQHRPDPATRKKCYLDWHMYNPIAMHDHHYIPRHTYDGQEKDGGTIYLCSNCHTIFHNRERQEMAKRGHRLSEEELIRLYHRVGQEIRNGKYGRK